MTIETIKKLSFNKKEAGKKNDLIKKNYLIFYFFSFFFLIIKLNSIYKYNSITKWRKNTHGSAPPPIIFVFVFWIITKIIFHLIKKIFYFDISFFFFLFILFPTSYLSWIVIINRRQLINKRLLLWSYNYIWVNITTVPLYIFFLWKSSRPPFILLPTNTFIKIEISS